MRNYLLSGLFLTILSGTLTDVNAQGYVHNLPLNLESGEQFYSLSNNGTAAISWIALNEINTLKTTSNAKTGTATMVLAIKDIPGILRIAGVAASGSVCTSGNHNSLTISESADNKSFSNPNELSSNNSQDFSLALKPDTRYIKFYFNVKANGIFNGSFCGHEFNSVKINLPKSVDIVQDELRFQGLAGSVKDTVTVNYSNPQGELTAVASSSNFGVRKLTDAETAGSEGTAQFEITYLATDANTETIDFIVKDENNELNADTIKITATSTIIFVPNAPASIQATKVGKSNAQINWSTVEGEIKHYLVVLKENGNILEEATTTDTSYEFTKLLRNASYEVEVKAIATNENISDAISYQFTTSNDFGSQMQNYGFEEWEGQGATREPLHWNSFGSATGDLAGMVKSQQVDSSNQTRPGSIGSSSAMVYSRRVIGIPANGNLTSGRINAGSMTASDYSNYNFTDPANADFNQIVTEYPDSASVWVYYKPNDASSSKLGARVSFILHGENDTELVKEPAAQVSPLISATAASDYTENNKWIRLSIPFEKAEATAFNTPKYMLTSFATNKTPGADTGGADYIYVDDLVLIYNPTLAVEALTTTTYAEGDAFEVPYTLTGSMSVSNINAEANTVYAELSDYSGSFNNPVVISEPIVSDESGVLSVQLPAKMITSENYKIRVVTTNYPMTAISEQALNIEGSDVANTVENIQASKYKLYPNPAKDRIFITNANEATYQICNLSNQVIVRNIYRNDSGIDVSHLSAGVYFIEIQNQKTSQKLKFIKE